MATTVSGGCPCCNQFSALRTVPSVPQFRFGATVPVIGSLTDVVEWLGDGMACFQTTIHSAERDTKGYMKYDEVRKFDPIDKARTIELCRAKDKEIFIHTPVMMNIGIANEWASKKPLKAVNNTLLEMQGIPGGTVLHMGAISSIETIADRIQRGIVKVPGARLLLENSAGEGKTRGVTWEEMRRMREAIDGRSDLELCLDTAHAFASGLSPLQNHEDIVRLFDGAKDCGWKIGLIHGNDSGVEHGRRCDCHACIARGFIWGSDSGGLFALLRHCADDKVPFVLETPDVTADLQTLQYCASKLEW